MKFSGKEGTAPNKASPSKKKASAAKETNNLILKHILKNAFDFKGKINTKFVLGIVLKENISLKENVPAVLQEIELRAREVAALTPQQIMKELQKAAPELLRETKEPKNGEEMEGLLKPLPNAKKGKVVVRIAPSPSGPLHIGHAYGASLNYEYAKMYQGKLILRIEDTNPENIYPPAYEMIEQDVRWLTENNVAEVVTQSSRLGIYYDYAEKLIGKEKVYVCTCDADLWREMKNNGTACPCRTLPVKENQLRYAKMFNGYAEGEAVLRLKTDIKHKNPAMRDFGIMRIIEHVHPKTGKEQRVWPLMVFSVAIDDHEMGITHVLNGKDHTDNAMKEKTIMDYFGWKSPEYKHWGRINFEGFKMSTSQTRLAIEQNEYEGWDDIRLPFLPALCRRGYQPEAFRKFALEMGLSLTDKTVSKEEFWKMVNAFNKEIVEPKANRYFFVNDPIEITIEKAPKKEVMINLHPDFPQRGQRAFHVNGKIYVAGSDFTKLGEGKIHRLMDYCNFMIAKGKWKYISDDYEEYKNAQNKGFIIHWVPVQKNLPKIEVLLEDGTTQTGISEEGFQCVKTGEIIQFERRYFGRVETINKNNILVYYLHK